MARSHKSPRPRLIPPYPPDDDDDDDGGGDDDEDISNDAVATYEC